MIERPGCSGSDQSDVEATLGTIRSLLEDDQVRLARQLAARAVADFPGDPEVERMHRVLRPGRVRRIAERVPDRRDAFRWLNESAADYRGQWVALTDEGLLAASPRLDELLRTIEARKLDNPPLVHFVA